MLEANEKRAIKACEINWAGSPGAMHRGGSFPASLSGLYNYQCWNASGQTKRSTKLPAAKD